MYGLEVGAHLCFQISGALSGLRLLLAGAQLELPVCG